MGSTSGRDRAALIDRLLEEAYRFDFFQAVRVLERWAARAADPRRRRRACRSARTTRRVRKRCGFEPRSV